VETFGQMDRVEKTEFILEQIRLVLDKKDYIKAQILSNKISRKALKDPEFQVLTCPFGARWSSARTPPLRID
jgi:26S proteasome regulatory subunit N5